jgi:hypothetical protein
MITWDSKTLYDRPTVGVCAISGAFETGRFFVRDGKRVFVGNTAAPDAVHDYVGFRAALGAVGEFKRAYSKADRWAERVGAAAAKGKKS